MNNWFWVITFCPGVNPLLRYVLSPTVFNTSTSEIFISWSLLYTTTYYLPFCCTKALVETHTAFSLSGLVTITVANIWGFNIISALSSLIRTLNALLLGSSTWLTLSILPVYTLSGYASVFTCTLVPSFTLAISASNTFAHTHTSLRSEMVNKLSPISGRIKSPWLTFFSTI